MTIDPTTLWEPVWADPALTQRAARTLPKQLWRVVFLQGYGWPLCTRREVKQRTFSRESDVARFVATLAALPNHHRMIGVWVTAAEWTEVDLDDLPELPDPDVTYDWNDDA